MFRVCTLSLVLAALLPASAAAAPGVLTLDGPDGAPGAVALGRQIAQLGFDDFEDLGTVADVLQLGDAPLTALGLPTSACSGEPVLLDDFLTGIDLLSELVDALQPAEALALSDQLVPQLPCVEGTISRDALFRLQFLRGMAHYVDGDNDSAVAGFRAALVFDPDRDWDTNYPPNAQQTFLSAKGQVVGSRAVSLTTIDRSPAGDYWIDGAPLAQQQRPLAAGMHLLQYRTSTGDLIGLTLEVRATDVDLTLPLVSRADAHQALLEGPEWADTLTAATAVMSRIASSSGADPVVVSDGSRSAVFEPARGRYAGDFTGQTRVIRSGPPPAGIATLVGGAVMGGIGLGIAVPAFTRGRNLINDADGLSSAEQAAYNTARTQSQVGTVLEIAGLATGITGLIITIVETRKAQRSVSVASQGPQIRGVGLMPSEEGVSFSLTGRF